MSVPVEDNSWQSLVASGRVRPPTEEGDVPDEAPEDYGVEASENLAAMRDDQR
jgi:hypothetical protein